MSDVPEQIIPITEYSEVFTAEATPIIQVTSQYGILNDVSALAALGGTAVEVLSLYECTSGTDPDGFGAISTEDVLSHRAAQGQIDTFSAIFSSGVVGNEQFAGFANASAALGFGRNPLDGEFGILLRSGGAIEIQELTITVPAAGAEAATVTIDGVGFPVALTAGTVQHNANEIADQLSATPALFLWDFVANNDQVIADAVLAIEVTGAFSFSSPGAAVAAWVQIAAGVLPNDDWVKQSDWSEDPYTQLVESNFNVYRIVGGGGVARFDIKSEDSGEFIRVHVQNTLNKNAIPPFLNPTFGHTWYALNRGATTSASVKASFAGLYREGKNVIGGGAFPIQNTVIGVGLTDVPIISIRCRNTIDDVQNIARAALTGIEVITDSGKAVIISLYFGGTLTDPVWQYFNKNGSIIELDTSATAISGFPVQRTGLERVSFDDIDLGLEPGDVITIAARITSGPASEFTLTGGGREDL